MKGEAVWVYLSQHLIPPKSANDSAAPVVCADFEKRWSAVVEPKLRMGAAIKTNLLMR